MMRKFLVIVLVVSAGIFCLHGCKKKTNESEAVQKEPRTTAEYKAKAEKQIDKKNMLDELDKLETEVEQDIASQE